MIIDRVAFFIHAPLLIKHYSAVWRLLNPESFEIILADGQQGTSGWSRDSLRDELADFGKVRDQSDLRARGERYRYLVTNHARVPNAHYDSDHKGLHARARRRLLTLQSKVQRRMGVGRRRDLAAPYSPLRTLAKHNIRFMYGADLSGFSLGEENWAYDLFLCHGPADAGAVSQRFSGKVLQMGYPRYDDFFARDPKDQYRLKRELGVDPNKPLVLWLPTVGRKTCFFGPYLEAVANLMPRYEVLFRPHPFTAEWHPDAFAALKRYPFVVRDDALFDLNRAHAASDFVLCDYGGSPYSALYLDRQFLLLDHPAAAEDSATRYLPESDLRSYLPSLSPDQAGELGAVLDDKKFWREQKVSRSRISSHFFADRQGRSAQFVAETLTDIRQVLS